MKNLKSRLMVYGSLLAALGVASCGEVAASSGASLPSGGTTSYTSTSVDSREVYKVHFNSCGGSEVAYLSGHSGDALQEPAKPTKSGYSFDNWRTAYDSSTKMGGGDIVAFPYTLGSANVVFYAHWTKASAGSHTAEQIKAYMDGLSTNSGDNHLYIHYYRFGNTPSNYADWDVWTWPYSPKAGEGVKFDWVGRTTSADRLSATGDATVDEFGGAYIDIDLTKTYDGGWSATKKAFGGHPTTFYASDTEKTDFDTKIGFQIVKSATRTSSSGFWANDGSDQKPEIAKFALANKSGGTSYHIFALQDQVASYQKDVINEMSDPFADDDGTNVTYGNSAYISSIPSASIAPTSPEFLKGKEGDSSSILSAGAGVGYQIMVSSFADSDGDGFGDIYGIEQKLDYIKNLGVNVLWLTPIQKSDSYHGYDITDYNVVDAKFGSSVSPASKTAGAVSEATALADYQSLIKAAHAKGMVVLMDLVLNHTSTGNSWFTQSAQLDADYRGYYQWGNNKTQSSVIKESNYWYPYGDHVYSYYAKFGSSMPELNYMYAPTRQAVVDMANHWCELGVDGFRMDAVKHIFLKDEAAVASGDTILSDTGSGIDYSSNVTKNIAFWKYLNNAVKTKHPNAFFVGENFDGHAYHVAPYYQGFDSLFDFYSYFNLTSAAACGLENSFTNAKVSASGFMSAGGSGYFASGDSELSGGKSEFSLGNGGNWNVVSVFQTYNKYRSGSSSTTSGSALPSTFTSNHDIARTINRIHYSSTDNNGISAQGNVSSSDYVRYNKAANLVKIAELMMPGCTFIYYGDELGMTGNFPSGTTSKTSYADLWYRQPMKWYQGGTAGDGHMTTSYAVTGSGVKVEWDSINASSLVAGAEAQAASSSSNYAALAKFAALKSTSSTLIRGDFVNAGSTDYVMKFSRSLGSDSYTVSIDFSGLSASVSHNGTVVASY